MLTGLNEGSLEQFEKIDSEKITGFLLKIFSADIRWDAATFNIEDVTLGVFMVYEAVTKPVVARQYRVFRDLLHSGNLLDRIFGQNGLQCFL